MIRTYDGGYMLTGYASSNDGDVLGSGTVRQKDYWLVKTDSMFNFQWKILIGGGATDIPNSIIQTTDSGFLVVGSSDNVGGYVQVHYGLSTYSDIYVAKVSKAGVFQWGRTLGGTMEDNGIDVTQAIDGNFIILGSSNSRDYDLPPGSVGGIVIFKLDSLGNILFVKTHGGTNGDYATQLINENDGSFLVVGSTGSNDGDVVGYIGLIDIWTMKIDSSGDIIWQKCYGSNGWEEANTAIKTNDGGYLIGAISFWGDGIIQNYSSVDDCWLLKIDSIGNYQWSKIFGGSNVDDVRSILQISDHEFIFTGNTRSYDNDVSNCYGIPNCREDVWMVKFSDGVNSIEEANSLLTDLNVFYKNGNLTGRFISNKDEKIEVRLFDITGKLIFSKVINSNLGINVFSYPVVLSKGVNLMSFQSGYNLKSIKFIVE